MKGKPACKKQENDPGDSFDGGYHLYAKEQHEARVAKTPDRIKYAIEQLEANNIEYTIKNKQTGHFHCRRQSDDELFQFWAGTGKIMGYDRIRGIHRLIGLLKEEKSNGRKTTDPETEGTADQKEA